MQVYYHNSSSQKCGDLESLCCSCIWTVDILMEKDMVRRDTALQEGCNSWMAPWESKHFEAVADSLIHHSQKKSHLPVHSETPVAQLSERYSSLCHAYLVSSRSDAACCRITLEQNPALQQTKQHNSFITA